MNQSKKQISVHCVLRFIVVCFIVSCALNGTNAMAAESPASEKQSGALPGNDLSRFDFFYAGEAKSQNMYIVKNGKITWEFKGPKDQGEISDAILMTNGNILFAHQYGVTLINQDKKVLWNYDAPKDCEIHTAQPIGNEHVVFVQCGKPAHVFVMNIKNGEAVKSFPIPFNKNQSVHGQLRHARLTPRGTYLLSYMGLGKICEYDINGKELFSMPTPGVWSAEPLKNDNILICGRDRHIREVNRKGEIIWDIQLKDLPKYNIDQPQIAIRRDNGNTIINNWYNQWSPPSSKVMPFQAIEVTPDKKVVWALKSWTPPVDLGPSTTIQILDENRISEKVTFGNIK